MNRYTITISKAHGGKYYKATVEAQGKKEAFIKVRDEAESKGIVLPDDVWVKTHRHRVSNTLIN